MQDDRLLFDFGIINFISFKRGHEIIGIDNLSRGTLRNLQEACGDKFDDLIFIKADLTIFDEKWVKNFYKSDIVIHLADVVAGIGMFLIMNHMF